jgi:hypothetical protein
MDAPENGRERRRPTLGRPPMSLRLTCFLLLLGGCASHPAPKAADPQAVVPPQTVMPGPAPPPSTVEEPVAARIRDVQPIVIEEGGTQGGSERGLASVAAAERSRRRQAAPPLVVITDKNLAEHATGKLTVSQGPPAQPGSAPPAVQPSPAKDEQYWRTRVHDLRQQWALAVDSITELEARAAGLRTRFYAQDDPYVRDGQIKPAWDRALDSLETSKRRARDLEEQLGQTLEEGRQSGALPGWLRDGMELEPSERPYDRPVHPAPIDDGAPIREPEELGAPPHR